jgi:ketosteroid isomerase-like protein
MKKYLWSSVAIILMAIASCQVKTELTDEQKAAIEKEVKDQYDRVISALEKVDVNAFTEYLSKDNFIAYNGNLNNISNRSAFIDSLTNWYSFRESQKVELVEIQVTALTSELALVTDKTNWDALIKDGTHVKSANATSVLWKKEESGWKQIFAHQSWEITE